MLPVLILIIGAIIDFGFIFAQQIAYNTAARDAARAGVLPTVAGAKLTCGQVASKARVGCVLRCRRCHATQHRGDRDRRGRHLLAPRRLGLGHRCQLVLPLYGLRPGPARP